MVEEEVEGGERKKEGELQLLGAPIRTLSLGQIRGGIFFFYSDAEGDEYYTKLSESLVFVSALSLFLF